MQPISVTFFKHAADVHPEGRELLVTWEQLGHELQRRLSAYSDDRRGLPMFVPARWTDNYRVDANVAAVTVGVLDLDNVPAHDVTRILATLQNVNSYVYASPRDKGQASPTRKLRVLVELDRELTLDEARAFRGGLAAVLGVEHDPTTVNESRGFFVGRAAGGADTPREFWAGRGGSCNVAAVLARAPALPEYDRDANAIQMPADGKPSPWVGELSAEAISETARMLAEDMQPGQKNQTVLAFGGWCYGRGIGAEDCRKIVDEALTTRDAEEGDVEDIDAGVNAALYAYREHKAFGFEQLKYLLANGEQSLADLAVWVPSAYERREAALDEDFRTSEFGQKVLRDIAALQEKVAVDEQRRALADGAPPQPGQDIWATFGGRRIDLTREPAPEQTMIEGLPVVRSQVNALIGAPYNGKSPTVASMALAIANGVPWLGRPTTKGNVTVLAYEAPVMMHRLLRRMARAQGLSLDGIVLAEMPPGGLSDPSMRSLAAAARHTGTDVLIIETYDSACTGEGQDKSYADPLKHLAVEGLATIVSMHTTKSSRDRAPTLSDIAGTLSLAASIKGAMGLRRVDPDGDLFELSCVRCANERFKPIGVTFSDVSGTGPDGKPDARWGLRIDTAELPAQDSNGKPQSATARAQQMSDGYAAQIVRLVLDMRDSDRVTQATFEQRLGVKADQPEECRAVGTAITALLKAGRLRKEGKLHMRRATDAEWRAECMAGAEWDGASPQANQPVSGTERVFTGHPVQGVTWS
jgi:hypothetical protein